VNYRIVHRTRYRYEQAVTASHHAARVMPRTTETQRQEAFELRIEPAPAVRKERFDYFGNLVSFFSVQGLHRQLEIVAESRVCVHGAPAAKPEQSPPWEGVAAVFRDPVSPEVVEPYQFCLDSQMLTASPGLADYARESFAAGIPLLAGVTDLTRRIHADFKYDPVATTVATPLGEVLEKRRGVCQDFAHLGIACLRSLGLPARYVSGYLRTHAPPGKPRLVGADASHAWFSVFCPETGWVDFDPTNNLKPSKEHITVAYGRDFSDVSPVSGIIVGGGAHEVTVAVDVEELCDNRAR
jgi:transglutaminase-like putative cysteine protease